MAWSYILEVVDSLKGTLLVKSFFVLNTFFQKNLINLGTWEHPATKYCHMIDFVAMRTVQRICCLDVMVMRGANCWTDHNGIIWCRLD